MPGCDCPFGTSREELYRWDILVDQHHDFAVKCFARRGLHYLIEWEDGGLAYLVPSNVECGKAGLAGHNTRFLILGALGMSPKLASYYSGTNGSPTK